MNTRGFNEAAPVSGGWIPVFGGCQPEKEILQMISALRLNFRVRESLCSGQSFCSAACGSPDITAVKKIMKGVFRHLAGRAVPGSEVFIETEKKYRFYFVKIKYIDRFTPLKKAESSVSEKTYNLAEEAGGALLVRDTDSDEMRMMLILPVRDF